MRYVIISFFLLIFIPRGVAAAQGPPSNRRPRAEEVYQRLLWAGVVENQTEAQIAKRREAQYKEREFLMKAEKLVQSWSALVREYSEKGSFNVKTAKKVSRAFHDLENSEGWLKTDRR